MVGGDWDLLNLVPRDCCIVKYFFVNYEALISEIENILRKLLYLIGCVITYLDTSNGTYQLWQ